MTNKKLITWLEENNACSEAIEWIGKRNLKKAWEKCERPDWMMWLYRICNPDKKKAVMVSIYCAKSCLKNYEKVYPNDKRVREAIDAASAWAKNPTDKNLEAAWSAGSAAWSAAWSAWSAGSAVRSAVRSAAESTAWSAESAAESAAEAAVNKRICKYIRKLIPNVEK